VVHDGIDTTVIKPNPDVSLNLGNRRITREDEVITFVNRNLEPYRGYHVFMRALPTILKARPNARVIIVGGDKVSYGAAAPVGLSWKQIYLDEVKDQLDLSRVHFVGNLPYQHFIPLLQLSRVHVYLTYPFVLSWSLLEAMSCACAIVASDTDPLREAIIDGQTGLMSSFFDPLALANKVVNLLQNRALRERLGSQARRFAIDHYDLNRICLPKMVQIIERYRV
jgi:glycosyltransferase involved in cell wall biosynthesis